MRTFGIGALRVGAGGRGDAHRTAGGARLELVCQRLR